jgi:hypothetical protein
MGCKFTVTDCDPGIFGEVLQSVIEGNCSDEDWSRMELWWFFYYIPNSLTTKNFQRRIESQIGNDAVINMFSLIFNTIV